MHCSAPSGSESSKSSKTIRFVFACDMCACVLSPVSCRDLLLLDVFAECPGEIKYGFMSHSRGAVCGSGGVRSQKPMSEESENTHLRDASRPDEM